MTRLTANEKVMLNQAKLKIGAVPTGAPNGIGPAVGALLDSALRPLRRAGIARQLARLDDRMLDDIGLQRWQIDEVADAAASHDSVSLWDAIGNLLTTIASQVSAWQDRRVALRELMALDDRMLRDVGIDRADIPAVIGASGRPAAVGYAADAGEGDAIEAVRRRIRSRAAAKDLCALDSRMLNDIDMVRDNIDRIADELAIRSLRPANADHAPQVA
jgi:uncharacterized protein YjiS (DUF1127 family)